MRDSRALILALTAVTIISAPISGVVWAAESLPVWPSYHMYCDHAGVNKNSVDISNPASLNLIWAFPRGAGRALTEQEEDTAILDDGEPGFTAIPGWKGGLTSDEAYGDDFMWKEAIGRDDVDANGKLTKTPITATWEFPTGQLPAGPYQIMVWVPAEFKNDYDNDGVRLHHNTTQAEYTVYDDTGATTIKFDQTDGGYWRLLTTRTFSFSGSAGSYRVELKTLTDDSRTFIEADRTIVVADAIKFVPGTGMEIYSSLASAVLADMTIHWKYPGDTEKGYTAEEGDWTGDVNVVYTGTVESFLGKTSDSPDTGAIYCVNSVTPYTRGLNDTAWEGSSEWKKATGLAEKLGTYLWRYPRTVPERLAAEADLEGPIEGGIYSSPIVAYTGDAVHPLITVVTAMDRQVYALDAKTGELLWKGPGVTVSEDKKLGTDDGWQVESPREAFGGKFHYIRCVGTGGAVRTSTWTFDEARRKKAEPGGVEGLSYAVYAWMPAKTTGDLARALDATYTITYATAANPAATAVVKIDQDSASNQGRWVRIGSSYFNVSSVSLSNITQTLKPGKTANDYCVVADAVMIVPDTIEAFTYSSPVVNIQGDWEPAPGSGGSRPLARRVFAATASGRILSFNLLPGTIGDPVATLNWIYPKVRTTLQVTGLADADAPSLGTIGASPAYDNQNNGRLFISTVDGKVRCIQGAMGDVTPSEQWVFPDSDDAENPDGFTSSPTLDPIAGNNQLFVGSTGGVFYCLDTTPNPNERVRFKYPADAPAGSIPSLPLGAFRYSTAAIGRDATGMYRVWIASTDGRIYSFSASPTDPNYGQRVRVEYDDNGVVKQVVGTWYNEPNVLAPMQASLAIDGSSVAKRPVMYVGDMQDKGVLRWFDITNGTSSFEFNNEVYKGWVCEGQLFSSPNITHMSISNMDVSYVYVGGSDGRIYAFSRDGGAWGGRWAGGEWPFSGNPNDRSQMERQLSPVEDIQFDIFEKPFYRESETRNAEPKNGSHLIMDDPWPAGWIVSKTMKQPTGLAANATKDQIDEKLRDEAKKQRAAVFAKTARTGTGASSAVYFEWGETLYLILWNLPEMNTLYGTSGNEAAKRANIRFNLANTSAGSSSGSQLRLAANCRVLKEYTVLSTTAHTGTNSDNTTFTYYDPLRDPTNSQEIKRCYALAQIDIRGTGSRPPSPGPGWVLTAEVRQKTKAGGADTVIQTRIPLAKLKVGTGGVPEIVLIPIKESQGATPTGYDYRPQLLGVNNPLAIRDDGNKVGKSIQELAWPMDNYIVDITTRQDEDAHFNGNARLLVTADDEFGYDNSVMPTLDLNIFDRTSISSTGAARGVAHGTSSREGWLGVMDRSATGLTDVPGTNPRRQLALDRFRVAAGDLRWRGGEQAISRSGGTLFPWELGVGSIDYPNIYERSQSYRKQNDGADPSRQSTALPSIIPSTASPGTYEGSLLRPDTVYVAAEVPRFQPANQGSSPGDMNYGYSRVMEAFIDSDGDQKWDSGDSVYGRPTTYQEAHRKFRARLSVPPDPRIEVEEQLIDVGQAPHGLGWGYDFVPYNREPDIRQWFKRVNIRNAGNVNLYNMQILKQLPLFKLDDAVALGRSEPAVPQIPGTEIRSTLDAEMPREPALAAFKGLPFITQDPMGVPLNYTLTKARVGDPDPTFLTVPDQRKWDSNYRFGMTYTQDAAADVLVQAGWAPDLVEAKKLLPLPVEVSVGVPLSQQIGTYAVPFVGVAGTFAGQTAIADPSFGLKVTVRENRLTGDRSPGVMWQIDTPVQIPGRQGAEIPRVGDATPAAYRDPITGRVHLFYSSNRIMDSKFMNYYPDWNDPSDAAHQAFAGAPWFIYESTLNWDPATGWQLARNASGDTLNQWWGFPNGNPFVPSFSANRQWPSLLAASGGSDVMTWKSDAGAALQSVKHFSPVIAENVDLMKNPPDPPQGLTWLAWAGAANIENNSDAKLVHEQRLFYTDATGGDVTNPDKKIYSIEHDPAMDKRYPSLSVFNRPSGEPRMWMFWQGGDSGKWSIYYSTNDEAPLFPSVNSATSSSYWTQDTRLRTPDCLSSMSSPNAVHREFWKDPDGGEKKDVFDVIYSGINKFSETPDILLGRYAAVAPNDNPQSAQPGRAAQPMPRTFGEKLRRDEKVGYFMSQHLAWLRPGRQWYDNMKRLLSGNQAALELLINDHPGKAEHIAHQSNLDEFFANLPPEKKSLYNSALYNMPYIWVRLPKGYGGNSAIQDGDIVSATSGIIPEFDDPSGVTTYSYPSGSLADTVLGKMLVDFSAGIVRFTKPLEELKLPDGTVAVPEVFADYTPQTWRLTTDAAVDNSPRAFIERTPMTQQANPGLSKDWLSSPDRDVDRLWVLWRRAGTAVNSSTVYWKTYRIGVELPAPVQVEWKERRESDGTYTRYISTDAIEVTGALGPWELDSTGRRIYFSEVDERYAALIKSGSVAFFTSPAPSTRVAVPGAADGLWEPRPIVIKYKDADGNSQTVQAFDVFWLEESPEQSLFGFVGDSSVNEGSVYAFADPRPEYWRPNPSAPNGGTWAPLLSSKIWVFWTSTRSGSSDLCWATLTPNFGSR